MEDILTPYENFVEKRDSKVVARFKELIAAGAGRNRAYEIISKEQDIPMVPTTVYRILVKNGVDVEQVKDRRKFKRNVTLVQE